MALWARRTSTLSRALGAVLVLPAILVLGGPAERGLAGPDGGDASRPAPVLDGPSPHRLPPLGSGRGVTLDLANNSVHGGNTPPGNGIGPYTDVYDPAHHTTVRTLHFRVPTRPEAPQHPPR